MPTLTFRPYSVAAPTHPNPVEWPGPRLFVATPHRFLESSPADPSTVRGEWQTIHAVADSLRPLMEAVVDSAFEEMVAAVDMREFAAAIATASSDLALAAMPWDYLESRLLRIEPILRVCFLAGGEVGAYYLGWLEEPKAAAEDVESLAGDPLVTVMSMLGPKFKGRMDLLNPRAVEWLKEHSTKLIKDNITPESKKAIREILLAGFQEGWGAPAETARRILPYVGLSSPLAKAVHNYELGLAEKGIDADKAQSMVKKYALRLRRYRARLIARTEMLSASNAGQREIWNQAGERGLLDLAESQRKWIITPDDRLCPLCKAMANQSVPVNQPFKAPDGGSIENPPLHPACRCAQGLSKVAPPKAPPITPPPPGVFPWREDQLMPVSASLEGAHPKQVFEAPDGSRWLFKPDETAGIAELAGYRLMRELGLDAPDVHLVKIGGKIGSIQKMWPDVATTIRIDGLASLTREQLEQIQRHQVADWLMSQHDTNNGAMLLSASGRVYAVDKGQALKFFGRDRLDWTYNPNPERLIYNRMFEDHIAGRITLDKVALAPILARVKALPDARLREIFSTYAEHAVKMGWVRTPEEILDRLVARKASLETDFDDLYRRADAEREKRLGSRVERPYTVLDDAFAGDVRRQGWAGRAIMVAGPELEDAHVLAYEIRKGDARMLVLEAKVRESYEGKILQAMGPVAEVPRGPTTHPRDDIWESQLLPAIKHISYHMKAGGDGVLTPAKIAGVQTAAKKLVDMSAAMSTSKKVPGDPDFEILKHYSSMIQQITGRTPLEVSIASAQQLADWCTANHQAWVGQVSWSQYQLPARPAAAPSGAVVAASRERPWQYGRTLQAGEIVATNARQQLHGNTAYTVDLGEGMTGVYIQHGDDNRYSKMGRLTIYRDNYAGTATEIANSLEQFRRLGLDVRLATRDDLEMVYLQKQAHAMKLENDTDWQNAIRRAESEPTNRGKLEILRDFFAEKLGIEDITRLKTYRPEPQFDSGWNPSSGTKADSPAGRPYWTRFDITAEDLEREMGNYVLTHSLSNATVLQFLERVFEGNGWLSNTEERIRIGVFRGEGMSPEEDMRTGGASYVFTRIKRRDETGSHTQLIFDPKILLRTDIISYNGDMYGRSDPETKARRNVTVEEWKKASRYGSNEAIIKNGMSLLDNLIQINTSSAQERNRVRDLFRSYGITRINGRDIEEVVN